MFSKMIIQQANNEYQIWTPQGIRIAYIVMPPDGRYVLDSKVLEVICRAFAHRWGIIERK